MKGVDCPYCSAVSFVVFARGERQFFRCSDCRLVFAYPPRNIEYSDYADRYPCEWRGEERQGVFSEALSFLDSSGIGNLLDIGCAGGALMSQAASSGWDVWGVDPALSKSAWKEPSLSRKMVENMEQLPEISFDSVLIINVLDQVANPWRLLADASGHMHQGGALVIRIPNTRFHRKMLHIATRLPSKIGAFLDSMLITHDYGLEPPFLNRVLSDSGFESICFYPSSLSKEGVYDRRSDCRFCWHFIKALLSMFSLVGIGHLVSPSLFIVARKS